MLNIWLETGTRKINNIYWKSNLILKEKTWKTGEILDEEIVYINVCIVVRCVCLYQNSIKEATWMSSEIFSPKKNQDKWTWESPPTYKAVDALQRDSGQKLTVCQ